MDEIIAHVDDVAVHTNLLVFRSDSGPDVVTPAVPRALDEWALQMAFTERSPRVRTGIVESIDTPFDVAECNSPSFRFNSRTVARRKV
jgi:hypothetical protein